MKIVIFYTENKNQNLEDHILETVRRYRGQSGEFVFNNGSFELTAVFKNEGQVQNFKNDLIYLSKPYGIKLELSEVFSLD